jgi:hypothetical protein
MLDRRIQPYRENYESSSSQKTDHPNCRGGKRSIALCGFRALFDSEPEFELISAAACPRSARCKACDLDPAGQPLRTELVRRDGQPEGHAAGFAHHRDRLGNRRRNHSESHRFRSQRLCGRSGHAGGIRAGDSHRESGVGMGSAKSALHVHRARVVGAGTGFFRRAASPSPTARRKCWRCWWPAAPTKKSAASWASKSAP